MLVSRIAHNEKIQYHQLTDKALPIDDTNNVNHIEITETDIDPLAPKGRIFFKIYSFVINLILQR
jgi:hypothetical protein